LVSDPIPSPTFYFRMVKYGDIQDLRLFELIPKFFAKFSPLNLQNNFIVHAFRANSLMV